MSTPTSKPTPPNGELSGPPAATVSVATPGDARRRRTLRIVSVAVAVVAVGVLVWALTTPAPQGQPKPGSAPGAAAPQVGHYAPNATLLDLSNHSVPLSSLRGKVVLINFWYVACEPCQYEMPALEKTYQTDQSKGFVVVGVDVSDDTPNITTFINRLGVTYPILRDVNARATVTYHLTDTPTSFLVDRQGVIRYKFVGPVDHTQLSKDVATLLAATP